MHKYLPADDHLIVRLDASSMRRLRDRRADYLELDAITGEVLAVGFVRFPSLEEGRLRFVPGDIVWCNLYSVHAISDQDAIVSIGAFNVVCKAER